MFELVPELLLFLLVFTGLSFLRTTVGNYASHEDNYNKMNRILALFSWVTLLILVGALFCIVLGASSPDLVHLYWHGPAVLAAIFLSLVFDGAPKVFEPTVSKYYGSGF